ncbi:hypothetical protein BDZ89DRAFT_1108257 [Hymenopellis radicata]|nr:hypothetical protein BDZ89DRAFT_1108257 [Hymenopellis radicata]
MSSTTPIDANPPPPPPGTNYIASIEPSLNMLLIGATWSSVLVPLLIALFLFSTPSLRRSVVFNLNVLSILLGIAFGILNYYVDVTAIISPDHPVSQATYIAESVLIGSIPFLVESILVVRVFAVYRPSQMTLLNAALVYVPIILVKIGRLINLLLFWTTWFPTLRNGGNPIVVSQQVWHLPYTKIEWFLQMFDNGYASALFLRRVREGLSSNSYVASTKSRASGYRSRLHALFWIGASNFVFPVILSLAQVIFAFRDSSFLHGSYILITNIYIEIIGVLLATVWASGSKWSEAHIATFGPSVVSSARFTRPGTKHGESTTMGMQVTSGVSSSDSDIIDASHVERGIRFETYQESHIDEKEYVKEVKGPSGSTSTV